MENKVIKYNVLIRVLHWLMGLMFIGMTAVGFYMIDATDELKGLLYPMHKKLGATLLILIAVRLLVRFASISPPPLEGVSKALNTLGRIVHGLLYVAMFVMPLSGYLMSQAAGKPVPWFWGIELPMLINKNDALASIFHSIHEVSAYLLVGLLFLHILATVKHILVDKIPVMCRILW